MRSHSQQLKLALYLCHFFSFSFCFLAFNQIYIYVGWFGFERGMLQGRGASHEFLSMQNIDVKENKNNMPDCFFLAHVEDSLFLFVVSFSASRLGGLGLSVGML